MDDSTGRPSSNNDIRAARDSNGHVYAFEDFELHTESCELFRSGRPAGLQLKPTRLLLYLIEHRERTVPKEELLHEIWPDNYVSESSFTTAIGQIRHALDDDGDAQRLIRTFRGRGYHFVGWGGTLPRTRRETLIIREKKNEAFRAIWGSPTPDPRMPPCAAGCSRRGPDAG